MYVGGRDNRAWHIHVGIRGSRLSERDTRSELADSNLPAGRLRLEERDRRLSSRQRDIMTLVVRGYSDKELSSELGLSIGTVKTHLGRIYRSRGLRNRAEAAAWFAEAQSRTSRGG